MSEPASSPKCDLCGAPVFGQGVCPRRQYTEVSGIYVMPKGCAKAPVNVKVEVIGGRKDEPGVKFDADKIRADLLPVEALEGIAAVLTYGANKYTQRWRSEWARLLLAPSVESIRVDTLWGGVVVATRSTSGGQIRSSLSASGRIDAIGSGETPTRCEHYKRFDELIRALESEMQRLSELHGSVGMVSPKSATTPGSGRDAGSAAAAMPNAITLTIATRPASSEASCAVVATTVSECLATMLRDWSARFPTFALHDGTVETPGERNWEKGMSWGRCYAACLRHLWAWWRGEDNDPETGLSHLDHALCCLLFLSTFVKRRVTTFDDRPHFRG